MFSAYSAPEPCSQYALANSFILDSGAIVHVCNNRTRIRNLRPAHSDDYLLAGKDTIPIEGFGSVEISVERESGGKRQIVLENTAFVPSFHTSVVSLRKFRQRNVYWDMENLQLVWEGKTFCKTPERHGQWVLEYNQPTALTIAFTDQSR